MFFFRQTDMEYLGLWSIWEVISPTNKTVESIVNTTPLDKTPCAHIYRIIKIL